MNLRNQKRALFLAIFTLIFAAKTRAENSIILNEKEYFEAPGFSFLLFHNNYQVGYQGGLQMIESGERVLDSGDLYFTPKDGAPPAELRVLRREVDRGQSSATVFGEIGGWNTGYELICRSDGRRIFVTLKLDKPVEWDKVQRAGFKIHLYPGIYFSKSFQGESGSGTFPQQFTGRPELMTGTSSLRVAEEDPLYSFTIARSGGTLSLADNRSHGPQPWFSVVAPFDTGTLETEIHIEITPSLNPEWRRAPVIGVSEVGYHPKQTKRAVLELDPREEAGTAVKLYQLQLNGEKKLVKSEPPKSWGRFLRYQYALFDFSEVREPGLYVLEYRGESAGPFRIGEDVYDQAWQPTLEYFLPAQMCHVAVREGGRTWHGACHLDDALQAPAGKRHIDGYQQGERETGFRDNEHVPGLDWGGWHDAGDNDVPAGSIAMTTLALALAEEEFKPELDRTAIHRAEREVLLHVADGRDDLLEQIEFGAESLLASSRISGHIFPGIIESNSQAYSHVGDPVNITDNRVYDAQLNPGEVSGERSGKFDDRWVFTNRNTGLQYEAVQTLAAASRVLREYRRELADECLAAARKIWQYEQAHAPVYPVNAYVPRDSGFRSEEISATAELLITTGEAQYRDRLLALLPTIRSISGEQFGRGPGWTLVRALGKLDNAEFKAVVTALAEKWKAESEKRAASNPYGVHYPPQVSSPEWKLETRSGIHSGFVWGHGWDLQTDAMRHYYFQKHLPQLFDKEPLLAVVNFVLGCHPANNESYVSGVGARSPLIAYGFNRADWSHIPGGVISGASLIKPDFMELKEFPFLWYQTEYVIHGGATFIFDVLAARQLLR